MKKTLIAIAALAATSAFAQVQITGTMDPSLAMTKVTSGTDVATTQTFLRNNSRGTTGVIFRISEDLGGGMSASALAEFDFNPTAVANNAGGLYAGHATASTAQNTFGSLGGEMYTALNGGFGSVRLGAANTPSLGAQGGRTPFGTKMGGGFGTTMGTSHVRESNSIVYVAPTMAGFTASLGHAFRVNADTLPALAYAGNKNDIGLAYAAGPLRANASFFSGQGNGQQNFMVQYDLGAATIYGGMHKEAVGGVANNSGTNLAVKYALNGTTSVMANIGKRDDKTAADQDQNITGLGMDYALSKRTTTYIRYENRKINNVVLATAAKQATTTAFGIQHNF